jgi:cardiolipin synthase
MRWLACLAGLSAGLATTACAVLPGRAAVPAAASPAAVARQVTVSGPDGPVSAAVELHTLAGVQAEGQADLMSRQLGTLAAQGEADLYRGNTAQLLVDGPATFAAMKQAIALARHRVLVESYIFEDAGIAAEIGALLLQRAAAGVAVALVYDSVGSWGTDTAFFDALAAGGVAVCPFNPLKPWLRPGAWSLAGINHRDHRKLMVVDAEVAFTGGINISRVYSSGSFRRRRAGADDASAAGWRDTQIALRGPVVGALAGAFADTWSTQGCPGALAPAPRPAQATPGTRVVKLLTTRPGGARNPIYSALLAAIDSAQRSVHLTMAYFAPGADMVQALGDAARRGVDVVLLLPGRSDFALVLHAGRANYTPLLAAGVQIHELQQALLHAKTAVVDGVWSTVGSSNLDWRSLADNSELNVVVLGDEFGQQMEALFRRDLATAPAVDPAAWQQRGWRDRALQQLGRLLERWL